MSKVEKADDKTLRLEVVFTRIDAHTSAISGFPINGSVIVHCPSETSHSGITLTVTGQIVLRETGGSSAFDALKTEPVTFYNAVVPIAGSAKLPPGRNPIPFEVELPRKDVFESYMGMYIDVRYTATVDMKRGKMHRNLTHVAHFTVIHPGQAFDPNHEFGVPIDFHLRPPAASRGGLQFEMKGRIDASRMDCTSPLTGHVEVLSTHSPIRAIKLQLIRVEEAVVGAKSAREASEIQSVYVAQGDVARGSGGKPFSLPLYMIFPRNYAAPTLLTAAYRVEYEVNLEVTFDDHVKVTQNFPVRLWRRATPVGTKPKLGVCWIGDEVPCSEQLGGVVEAVADGVVGG